MANETSLESPATAQSTVAGNEIPTGSSPELTAAATEKAATSESSTASTNGAESKPDRTFTQAEVDAAIEKRVAREHRKQQRLEEEFRQLALRQGGEQPKPAQPQPTVDAAPKRADYADDESYIDALIDHKAEQKIAERERVRQEHERIRTRETEAQSAVRQHQEREKAAQAKYPDYAELITDPDLRINDVMANAIVLSDVGPEVAYYFGKHPDEAARIYDLSPLLAVKEIGRIEAKLAAATPPETPVASAPVKSSNAPAPIDPVGGKAAANSGQLSDKDPIELWVKKREAALRQKAQGR